MIIDPYPTGDQKKAIKSLERAFAKCLAAKVHFHNCYGTLIAYNGNVVKDVNDTKSETSCQEGYCVKTDITLNSWADDGHYLHEKQD